MQESFLGEHFTQAKLGKDPVFFQLRAANRLEIPYIGFAVLDFEWRALAYLDGELLF